MWSYGDVATTASGSVAYQYHGATQRVARSVSLISQLDSEDRHPQLPDEAFYLNFLMNNVSLMASNKAIENLP